MHVPRDEKCVPRHRRRKSNIMARVGGRHDAFRAFSANLYCSGSEAQTCPDGKPAGICYWHRPDGVNLLSREPKLLALTTAHANQSWDERSRRFPSDRWDPVRSGSSGTTLAEQSRVSNDGDCLPEL